MDINKIFAEIGRMHLEISQLREQLTATQAELAALKSANSKTEEKVS